METFDKSLLNIFRAELAAFQILLHDLVIALSSSLDKSLFILGNQICHVSRNIYCNLFSTAGWNHISLLGKEVNYTLEIFCIAHWNDNRNKSLMEFFLKVIQSLSKRCSVLIHLVDEDEPWDIPAIQTPPQLDGLDLSTCIGTYNQHSGLACSESQDNLSYEVRCTRSIYKIKLLAIFLDE